MCRWTHNSNGKNKSIPEINLDVTVNFNKL